METVKTVKSLQKETEENTKAIEKLNQKIVSNSRYINGMLGVGSILVLGLISAGAYNVYIIVKSIAALAP